MRSSGGGRRALLPLLGGALLLAGCSHFRTEWGRSVPAAWKEFAEGQTRVEGVVRALGPPISVSALPNGFAFLYERSKVSEFQLGISINWSFLKYLKFVKAWNGLDHEALVMTFDGEGVLRGIGSGRWDENLGGGSAIQILVTVVSLTNVAELWKEPDALHWGSWMLQPPPVALNSGQSLRTGAHGLEQRVAPGSVGQSTLEMVPPSHLKERKRRSQE